MTLVDGKRQKSLNEILRERTKVMDTVFVLSIMDAVCLRGCCHCSKYGETGATVGERVKEERGESSIAIYLS